MHKDQGLSRRRRICHPNPCHPSIHPSIHPTQFPIPGKEKTKQTTIKGIREEERASSLLSYELAGSALT
jgi:hypothetical protein